VAERVDRNTAPEGGSGVFIKPEDGKPVRIRIVDGPVKIQRRFQNNPAEPLRDSFIYLAVALESDQKGEVAKGPDGQPIMSQGVIELGANLQRQIASMNTDPDFGDVSGYNIKYSCTGKDKQKRYSLQALRASDIKPYTDFMKTIQDPINLDEFATKMETGNWDRDGQGGSQGQPSQQQTSGQGAAPVDEYDPFAD
jgi:hypothetical protein